MKYDITIIGAGIVGLASALKLSESRPDLKVLVLDKESEIARHQTGHNSGVIHSGIYYKPGSLKAKNCAEGREALLEFCKKHNIKYEQCGKIIIATKNEELSRLDALFERGNQNGLLGIKKINSAEIKEYEPHAAGLAGIFVPQTGIVDYGEVAKKYAELFQKNGGQVILSQRVENIRHQNNFSLIKTQNSEFEAGLVINCAGLYSDKLAMLAQKRLDVRIIPFRGEYYGLKAESRGLIRNLIYPVPDPAFPFLGVHFPRRVDGEVEAGPNAVFAFRREGYGRLSFNLKEFFGSIFWPGFLKVALKNWKMGAGEYYRSFNKAAFVRALQKLVPEISEKDLVPGGSGVRAQACARDGKLIDDFLILESASQIDVLNAPSPAATASLSIGAKIAETALKRF